MTFNENLMKAIYDREKKIHFTCEKLHFVFSFSIFSSYFFLLRRSYFSNLFMFSSSVSSTYNNRFYNIVIVFFFMSQNTSSALNVCAAAAAAPSTVAMLHHLFAFVSFGHFKHLGIFRKLMYPKCFSSALKFKLCIILRG